MEQDQFSQDQFFDTCINESYACATACDFCAASCLSESNVQAMTKCIKLAIDCAEICRLAASYMGRDSDMASIICTACAQVCDTCGEECSHHQLLHCQQCAEACRSCATECRRMAAAWRQPAAELHAAMAAH